MSSVLLTGCGIHVPIGVGGGAFDPLSLNPSLYIDASDTSTMFVSNAGTTTVTDTSSCGYAGDKSGNARHFTSTADTTIRPTWNLNGGLSYLLFNGSTQFLRRTSALGIFANGSYSVFMAGRATATPGTNKIIFGDMDSVSTGTFAGLATDVTTQTTGGGSYSPDSGGALVTATKTNTWSASDIVAGFVDTGTLMTAYADQTAGTGVSYTHSMTHTPDRCGLGALFTSITTAYFNFRLYALVAVPSALSGTDLTNLITWLGAKQGRSI